MLVNIEEFRSLFAGRGIEAVCPPVVQTLSEAELERLLPDVDGWIAGDDPVTERVLRAGMVGRLRAVVKWGVGVDNVDFEGARRMGIPVTNTPQMFGGEVADMAVSYAIALARETFLIDNGVRQGLWPKPTGISLWGRTVALVGYGDIGRNVARRLLAADMQILVYDPGIGAEATIAGLTCVQWPDRIEEADFIVFTCALTRANRGMLNADTLRRAQAGVRIVNVARGPLIDEGALVNALRSGHVHSAALDVFEVEPLPGESALREFGHRVLFGSHNGSNTIDAVRRTSHRAIELLTGLLDSPVSVVK